jgi:hypothetical protein
MLAEQSDFSTGEFAGRKLNERFILVFKLNPSGTEMYGAKNWVFLSIDVFLVHVTLEHDLRKQDLPNLPFSLNNIVLFLNFCTCFFLNFFSELTPILFMCQVKELVWIVLFEEDSLLFYICAKSGADK